MNGEVTLLGVRHHGPGSARAVGAALARLRPDAVLIEGPPEADPIIALAAERDMVPPVALLAHAVDEPARAAFWPFAAFSPEWVAIQHALAAGIPVRFIDLPAASGFALAARGGGGGGAGGGGGDLRADPVAALAAAAGRADVEGWWEDVVEHRLPGDDPLAPFAAVAEAMAVLRDDKVGTPGSPGVRPEGTAVPSGRADGPQSPVHPGAAAPPPFPGRSAPADPVTPAGAAGPSESHAAGRLWSHRRRDDLREAYMRQQIRTARRAGHRRIAVVCGAWHVPALSAMPTAAADRSLLAGLPKKLRTEITWVPWTHRRLSQHTGYGAGIESPGWYQHLFERAGERGALARWLTRAAELLRAEDHPVSSAHVIESVRLADALAAMRGRPAAGLAETLDAVQSVMCDGSPVALALVHDRLVVGDALGGVPADTPTVPLQRDLNKLQRSLRLRPESEPRELVLDLRRELDAARSLLLHRLRLLGIGWGTEAPGAAGSTGTFRESWRLCWDPEFAVRVVEAAQWGTTVEEAAAGRLAARAGQAGELADLTRLAEQCLVAHLPAALPAVMRELADRAALDTDAGRLAEALPALVRALRYGDVRGTDSGALGEVARGLAERICVGLPAACTALDAARAAAMRTRLDAVHTAIGLLDPSPPPVAETAETAVGAAGAGPRDALADRWAAALAALVRREPTGGPVTGDPGRLRGRAVRLLLDDGALDAAEAGRRLRLVLSPAGAPADAAGWIEGFLSAGGALLLLGPQLLALLDEWLIQVPADTFTDVLPLLRRTFADLEAGVRRTVGARVAAGPLDPGAAGAAGGGVGAGGPRLDPQRADATLPDALRLLGLLGPAPATADHLADPAPAGPEAPAAVPRARPRIPHQSDRRSSS
ncbi:DUF5682 family protein [Kitasatospora nipponensis]|uniref:DUF5682 family protein n=1 Tax=Kitasatospora nipponensis TaxID=258049 RepID=A0ABP4HSQ7_9ACTN